MLAFKAARLLTQTGTVEQPLLLVEAGRIVEVSSKISPAISSRRGRPLSSEIPICDFGDSALAAGYIDLHIHGSGGFDVMDDRIEALPTVERLLARHGVTSYFPTTVTAPLDATLRALERLAMAIAKREKEIADGRGKNGLTNESPRAIPLGIHLEGPYISHARRGVHPPENLLAPTLSSFEKFWQAAQGRIRMMTIAPELNGADEVIAEAASRGVCVSLGHSDADLAATQKGIAAGARHATHTFNAMRPLDHRSPGILGAVLTDARVSADIIADGIHLDPAIVKLFAEAKGSANTVLITDAISATGMPEGRYRLGSLEVDVRDGKCMTGGKLAGSILTMDRAVRNLAKFAEWELPQAMAAASRNPARAARIPNKGNIAAGADADFIVLNAAGEVLRTFVGGVECAR
jgi:N-acetylglucosamine-6-phosphate deacetylase